MHITPRHSVSTELLVGTCGWQYAQWEGSFYPEDLPRDWQLGYYSNELNTVLVPEASLLRATGLELQSWHEDVGDEFRFFIELAHLQEWRRCMAQITPILDNVAGFALRLLEPVTPMLLECLAALAQIAPVCVAEPLARELAEWDEAGAVPSLGRLVTLDPQLLPHSDTADKREVPPVVGTSLFLIEPQTHAGPKQIRSWLEVCHESVGEDAIAAMLFTGAPPNIAVAKQALQLQELMR